MQNYKSNTLIAESQGFLRETCLISGYVQETWIALRLVEDNPIVQV